MFDRFRVNYAGLRDANLVEDVSWRDERSESVKGFTEFIGEYAGASFAGGLYRVHDRRTVRDAMNLVAEAFSEFADRALPFGYDWLGRQFAIDVDRRAGGQPQVLLLEPGTAEASEIPASFEAFHDDELVDYADAALALGFFEAWSALNPGSLPLRASQCVGYRVPLFLGGQDAVDNLELVDLSVYWSICGQLRRGTRNLPRGAPITEVEPPS